MVKKPSKIKTLERKKEKEKINKSSNYSKDSRVEEEKKKEPLHIVNTVPVIEEEFSVSKKTVMENVKVEKKWNTTTKKIEVPVSFEEVYINGKDLKSYGEEDEDDILSELNKRIIKSYEDMDNAQKKQYSVLERNESKREVVPLYNVDDDNRINNIYNDITDRETEKKIIPILGEEIIVNKRIVKLGELILVKNKVTENQKIAVDTTKEKATIRYPDGSTQNL